jgi:hypothetical protein
VTTATTARANSTDNTQSHSPFRPPPGGLASRTYRFMVNPNREKREMGTDKERPRSLKPSPSQSRTSLVSTPHFINKSLRYNENRTRPDGDVRRPDLSRHGPTRNVDELTLRRGSFMANVGVNCLYELPDGSGPRRAFIESVNPDGTVDLWARMRLADTLAKTSGTFLPLLLAHRVPYSPNPEPGTWRYGP